MRYITDSLVRLSPGEQPPKWFKPLNRSKEFYVKDLPPCAARIDTGRCCSQKKWHCDLRDKDIIEEECYACELQVEP